MIQKLTHRFSDVGEELMWGIQAFDRTTVVFLSEDALKSLANLYMIQLKPEELLVAKIFITILTLCPSSIILSSYVSDVLWQPHIVFRGLFYRLPCSLLHLWFTKYAKIIVLLT